MRTAREKISGCKCRHFSIFPGRLHPSIFDVSELNFRVRNGNGWNLTAINTDSFSGYPENRLASILQLMIALDLHSWKSPRPISTRWLHMSPYFHLVPIYLIVFEGSYSLEVMGYLILRTASRLDAFSVYPIRT